MLASARVGPSPLPLGRFPVVHTSSLDEAREVYARLTTPVKVVRVDRKAPFEMRSNAVSVGPLLILAQGYGGSFSAVADGAPDVFAISFPLSGATAQFSDANQAVPLAADRSTWVSSPNRPILVEMGTGYRGLHLVVRPAEMEAALAALLGTNETSPLVFEPRLSLASGAGASLQRLVRFVSDEADREDGAFSSPIVAARLADAVLYKLLLEHPHNHSERLRVARSAEPRHVRMAAEYLEANVARPVRMNVLAGLAGVSLRALQLGFREHRGCSPMQFLTERRLTLARTRLLGEPTSSITRIALDCGFEHLGRFSARYRAHFGESPSATRSRTRRS